MKLIAGTPRWRYITPGVLLVLSICYWIMAMRLPGDAGLMPLLVGTVLVILLPIDLVSLSDTPLGNTLRERFNPVAGEGIEELGPVRTQVIAFAWVVGFAAAMFLVGISLAVMLYIAGSLRFLGKKSWKAALIGGAVVGAANYLLFQWGLGVELYPGVLLADA